MTIVQPDRVLLARFIAEHAHEMTGDVLDVGGGPRRYAGAFAHAHSYRTLDIDPKTKPDILSSATEIPLPDASVDSIICAQVLGDIASPKDALREMARILKPGGKLLVTEALTAELHDEPHDFWRFTPYGFQMLLEPEFTNIHMELRGGFRCVQLQNWIRYWIDRLSLHSHPIFARAFSLLCTVRTKYAIARDAYDASPAKQRFALGCNIIATRA